MLVSCSLANCHILGIRQRTIFSLSAPFVLVVHTTCFCSMCSIVIRSRAWRFCYSFDFICEHVRCRCMTFRQHKALLLFTSLGACASIFVSWHYAAFFCSFFTIYEKLIFIQLSQRSVCIIGVLAPVGVPNSPSYSICLSWQHMLRLRPLLFSLSLILLAICEPRCILLMNCIFALPHQGCRRILL